MNPSPAQQPASRLVLRAFPVLSVLVVLSGWFSVQLEGGYFDPLLFGRVFEDRVIPEVRAVVPVTPSQEIGYDGQFYVQMAVRPRAADPLLQAALDNAPYRLRRIGWPALVHALCFGQPTAIVHAYLWSNLVCWLLLAGILWRRMMAEPCWKNAFGWFLLVTGVGVLSSVRCSLLDLPALLALLLALRARETNRWAVCAAFIALAAMIKETSLLGVVLLWPEKPGAWRAWIRSGALAGLAALPVLIWTMWLGSRFGWDLVAGHDNLALPAVAAFTRLGSILGTCVDEGFSRPSLWPLVTWLGLAFQLVCLVRWSNLHDPLGKLGIAFALLLVCSGPNVWGELVMAVPRAVVPVSLAAVLVAVQRRAPWPWIAGHVLLSLHGWDMLKLPLLRHIL